MNVFSLTGFCFSPRSISLMVIISFVLNSCFLVELIPEKQHVSYSSSMVISFMNCILIVFSLLVIRTFLNCIINHLVSHRDPVLVGNRVFFLRLHLVHPEHTCPLCFQL